MRLFPLSTLTSLAVVFASAPLLAMPHPHRGPTSPKTSPRMSKSFSQTSSRGHVLPRATHVAAPVGIAPERAVQIQSALIRSGYLAGEPTGVWDSSTQAAMSKLQAANGWQTKVVPDSRAIIKLGLGPGSTPEASTFEAAAPAMSSEAVPSTNQ